MSWELVALVSVLSTLGTAVYLFKASQRPIADKRVIELEKRLATAQDKLRMIENPQQRAAVSYPFHMGGGR